jgi:hypothetical protein
MTVKQDDNDERMLSEVELAARFGCSVKWCQARRLEGNGVPYHRLSGGLVRYKVKDIEAFEHASLRTSTSDKGAGDR